MYLGQLIKLSSWIGLVLVRDGVKAVLLRDHVLLPPLDATVLEPNFHLKQEKWLYPDCG